MEEPPTDPNLANPANREPLSLEVRLVAMVLGEASDFERAELEAVLATRPDLAVFTRRIAALHRLGEEAWQKPKPGSPWQLSPERRALLLQTFGAPSQTASSAPASDKKKPTRPWRWRPVLLPLAAALLIALIPLLMLPQMRALFSPGPQADARISSREVEHGKAEGQSMENAFFVDLSNGATVQESSSLARSRLEAVSSEIPATAPTRPAEPRPTPAPSRGPLAEEETFKTAVRQYSVGPLAGTASNLEIADRDEIDALALQQKDKAKQAGSLRDSSPAVALGGAAPPLHGSPTDSRRRNLIGSDKIELKLQRPTSVSAPVSSLFEKSTADTPTSTFSLHVADVSFRLASEALIQRGERPEPASVRPEEFTAAFDYGDPAPAAGEAVALAQDQSAHPFLPSSLLLRISLRTASEGRAIGQPLNLIVLLDKSGSMERPDRAAAASNALTALNTHLTAVDQLTVVAFDREARLITDRATSETGGRLLLETQQAYGESGTNLENAMRTVNEVAASRQMPGAVNRVLLVTDGVANLGSVIPENLAQPVETLRQQGFAFDVAATGTDPAGDAVLAAMARGGDGRYFAVSPDPAQAEAFSTQLAGAFRPAAKNVKVQIRFNPRRVTGWTLLGFEEHRLNEEDFRDDTVDAAELAATEQGSALYQLQILPDGEGEIGQVSVRFEETASGQMTERTWTIPYDPAAPDFASAPPALQLAAAATLFAEWLRGSATGGLVDLETLQRVRPRVRERYPADKRVQELFDMLGRAAEL